MADLRLPRAVAIEIKEDLEARLKEAGYSLIEEDNKGLPTKEKLHPYLGAVILKAVKKHGPLWVGSLEWTCDYGTLPSKYNSPNRHNLLKGLPNYAEGLHTIRLEEALKNEYGEEEIVFSDPRRFSRQGMGMRKTLNLFYDTQESLKNFIKQNTSAERKVVIKVTWSGGLCPESYKTNNL